MKIKVLSNFGGSLAERSKNLVVIENVGHDMEQAGWTLATPAWSDGDVGGLAWYDLASGDFYNYEEDNSYNAKILLDNIGGEKRIKSMVERFLESEKAH